MIKINNQLISSDIIEKKFICDFERCKGTCCIHGDSGAPLENNEIKIIEKIYPKIKPYLRKEGIKAVEQQGKYSVDMDSGQVTPLINGRECAYTFFEDGITKCAIERAYFDKKIKFRKPISCHLYPIRIQIHKDFEALNYDIWGICKAARDLGAKLNVPVYKFLKEPLIRKYGESWYKQLINASTKR